QRRDRSGRPRGGGPGARLGVPRGGHRRRRAGGGVRLSLAAEASARRYPRRKRGGREVPGGPGGGPDVAGPVETRGPHPPRNGGGHGRGERERGEVSMARWLVKEEPENYAFEDLQRDGKTVWEGVKNPLAR